MSEFMRLRSQIDELTAQLEQARLAELEQQCEEIRERIVAFNISAEMLFPELAAPRPRRRESSKPAKYEWNGHKWHGGAGPKPKWFQDALKMGITAEQMLAKEPNATVVQFNKSS